MDLSIGNKYKKSDFGITGGEKQWSEFTVEGELFTFFSNLSEYQNIIEKDGFVYECRGKYGLIPDDKKSELHRYVFLKEEEGSYYRFLGKGKYETRYDNKRNKIYF